MTSPWILGEEPFHKQGGFLAPGTPFCVSVVSEKTRTPKVSGRVSDARSLFAALSPFLFADFRFGPGFGCFFTRERKSVFCLCKHLSPDFRAL